MYCVHYQHIKFMNYTKPLTAQCSSRKLVCIASFVHIEFDVKKLYSNKVSVNNLLLSISTWY